MRQKWEQRLLRAGKTAIFFTIVVRRLLLLLACVIGRDLLDLPNSLSPLTHLSISFPLPRLNLPCAQPNGTSLFTFHAPWR
jgi:hypothetical protein